MPYARGRILIPGTLNLGYAPGAWVPPDVVENWSLTDDEVSADPAGDQAAEVRVARPADDTSRAEWVAYAQSRGGSEDDLSQMSIEEIAEAFPEEDAEGEPELERPADSAKKAEWVEWAVKAGAAEEWARDDSTTKAQLQDFEPGTPFREGTTDPAADQGNATVGQ